MNARTNADQYSPGPAETVVSFEDVTKFYGDVRAVDSVSFALRGGEVVAFLGPNGAGKSTSLEMLLGLRRPTNGTIRVCGRGPYEAVKAGRVGAMLQSGGLMPEVTVSELIGFVAGLHPHPVPVAEILRRAGVAEIATRRVDRLSGGQTQRVRFALAIAGEVDLLVLDEPTAAMDVATRQSFWADMRAEVARGRTLLFATHYLEEADHVADRVLVINRGRLVVDGTPSEIKALAGRKEISFRHDGIDEPTLRGLPGAVKVEVSRDRARIESEDADRTLYALLDKGYRPADIAITGLDLEQAFLALTTDAHPDQAGSIGNSGQPVDASGASR